MKGAAFRGPGGLLAEGSLKTKLLLMMLSLLVLSVLSLFLLHFYSERKLLSKIREYTDELSTAIDIAQEQPASEADAQAALRAYAERLRQLGVKDISILGDDEAIQASTNPENVGKKVVPRTKRRGPKQFVVRGVLGDEVGPPGSQKTSTLTIPIVVNDRRIGYLLVTRILDDFSALSQEAFLNRLVATLVVFAVGMVTALYLAWSFSRPLQALTDAAQQVAAGNLTVKVAAAGQDELGRLTRTFNEMVERIRENRLLEERLHFAERRAALGRLASAVAHEVRNPLNLINLSIDHLRDRILADVERREELDRVLANVKSELARLNRLVGDFLSFGKPMRLQPRPCALGRVVREVAELVEPKTRDQSVSLTVETASEIPEIVADPELLKTCFLNLMINGMDAMPEGGSLRIEVSAGKEAGQDVVVASVSDTGHGMTPDEIKTAFEPYFSSKETGLGLGLALTKKIVEDHGGTIALESAPGKGTTARVVLPAATAAVPAHSAEALAS
jgi:signal transduction histidine kinase